MKSSNILLFFISGSHKSKHRSQPSCHSISDLSTLTAHSPITSLHFSSSHSPPNTERPKEAFQEVTADFDMKLSAHERWVRALKKVLKKNSAILQPVSEGRKSPYNLTRLFIISCYGNCGLKLK